MDFKAITQQADQARILTERLTASAEGEIVRLGGGDLSLSAAVWRFDSEEEAAEAVELINNALEPVRNEFINRADRAIRHLAARP